MQYDECCLLVDCPIVSGNLPSPTDIPRHMVVYIMLLIKRREKKKRKNVGIFRCQFNRSSGSYSVEVLPVCQDRQWEAANRALLCGHVRRFIWFLYFKNKNYILWTSGTLTFLFGAETNLQPSTQSTTQLVLSLRDLCACATAIARQRDRNRKTETGLILGESSASCRSSCQTGRLPCWCRTGGRWHSGWLSASPQRSGEGWLRTCEATLSALCS